MTAEPGRGPQDPYAAVHRHVVATQWVGCRPIGWLFDPSTVCVDVRQDGDHVRVTLTGRRD